MLIVKKKIIEVKHPRATKSSSYSITTTIKVVLVVFIILLFIFSLVLGIKDKDNSQVTDKVVLSKLQSNNSVILSSYKQYMVGDPFINKMQSKNYYVIIYDNLRIVYDYQNDDVISVMLFKDIKG